MLSLTFSVLIECDCIAARFSGFGFNFGIECREKCIRGITSTGYSRDSKLRTWKYQGRKIAQRECMTNPQAAFLS